MVLRQPRGYARNIPSYREISEGIRPTFQDTPLEAYTGLPIVRSDEVHHDPIVIDPGTLVGVSTGYLAATVGKVFPCTMGTGVTPSGLWIQGSSDSNTTFGLPSTTSVNISCGIVKPLGVVFQPIYSFILQSAFTNYKRTANVGVLTDYVISVPAVNDEEVLIEAGDLVIVGTGVHYGLGVDGTASYSTTKLAGRYARYSSSLNLAAERIVGKCYRKLLLGSASAASTGDTLASAISAGTFTISTAATTEFANLAKLQTVPGLGLSGSGTSGIPAYLLTARCDASKNFYALTMLIRI